MVSALEPILGTTYGLVIYQEQVMEIAQKLAGYTLGNADLLRRAMGKKKKEVLDAEYVPSPRA
jgi:DNA polymerase-3 subunit alpha